MISQKATGVQTGKELWVYPMLYSVLLIMETFKIKNMYPRQIKKNIKMLIKHSVFTRKYVRWHLKTGSTGWHFAWLDHIPEQRVAEFTAINLTMECWHWTRYGHRPHWNPLQSGGSAAKLTVTHIHPLILNDSIRFNLSGVGWFYCKPYQQLEH